MFASVCVNHSSSRLFSDCKVEEMKFFDSVKVFSHKLFQSIQDDELIQCQTRELDQRTKENEAGFHVLQTDLANRLVSSTAFALVEERLCLWRGHPAGQAKSLCFSPNNIYIFCSAVSFLLYPFF